MELNWIEWENPLKPRQKYAEMVVQVTKPEMGNAILECELIVGRQVQAYSVFNKACRTVQYFKRYRHKHTTTYTLRRRSVATAPAAILRNLKPASQNTRSNAPYAAGIMSRGGMPRQDKRVGKSAVSNVYHTLLLSNKGKPQNDTGNNTIFK